MVKVNPSIPSTVHHQTVYDCLLAVTITH